MLLWTFIAAKRRESSRNTRAIGTAKRCSKRAISALRRPATLRMAHSENSALSCACGETPMPERLILCGGAKWAGGSSPLRLSTSGQSQNIVLELEDIGKKMVKRVPDLLADLIEIATYVYCADRATTRGGLAQRAMGAEWRRSFHFIIPTRNPDHWNHSSVLDPLRAALSFLSDDDYKFEFESATNPVALQDYLKFGDDGEADEVVPFSGGLDSLSGAIEELSTRGKRIALVSHRSSSNI
jgi:hypothetical protein